MFEAYKIGIKVSLINHVSHGMNMIIEQMTGGGKEAKALRHELNQIKLLGIGGAAIAGGGFMGLGLIQKTVKPASEYVHQLAQMNMAGMKQKEIIDSVRASWGLLKSVPSASVTENLEAIRDLRMVAGSTEHAIQYLPTLQKAQGILGSVLGGGHAFAKGSQAYDMAKALEMKGAVKDPKEFAAAADSMTKALVATGGKVSAADFLNTFKYARAATAGWDAEFVGKYLPTFIQEMKARGGSGAAGGAGPGFMSAYAAVVGGTITQRALSTWQKLGLVDMSKVVMTKDGHLKGVQPHGIIGSDLFQANPYRWVQDVLRPAMTKAGVVTETQQREYAQFLFPNRTAGFIITQALTQAWKFERDRLLIDQAKGIGSYESLLKEDPVLAKLALAKQWDSLLASLGYNIMPEYIKVMQMGIDVTRSASRWVHEHSTLTKVLTIGFVSLSGAMAISGTLTVLYAGWRALQLVLPGLAGGSSIAAAQTLALSASLAGRAGLVGASAAAGYAIGKLVNKLLGIDKGEAGSWLYDKNHPKGTEPLGQGWVYNKAGSPVFVGLVKNPVYNEKVNKGLVPKYITNPVAAARVMQNPLPATTPARTAPVAPKVQPVSQVWNNLNKVQPVSQVWNNVNKTTTTNVAPAAQGSRQVIQTVKPRDNSKVVQLSTRVDVDGRTLATALTRHLLNEFDRPQSGVTGIDFSMTPVPAMAGF